MGTKKVPVEGKKDIPGFANTDVEIEVDDAYEVVKKNIPAPTPYPTGTSKDKITWFNAFGIKGRDGNYANVNYTVRLVISNLPANKRLFVLLSDGPNEITSETGNGKIKYKDNNGFREFNLNVGDPPVGTYP